MRGDTMTAVRSYVAACGGFLFEFAQVACALQNACLYLEPLSAVQRLTLVCPGLALLFLSRAPVALARRGTALWWSGAVHSCVSRSKLDSYALENSGLSGVT